EKGVNPRDFRLWVCLHEVTHRVQITGVPWLRDYVRSQMADFLLASELDVSTLLERLRTAVDVVTDALRGGDGNLIDAIQTPRQREILGRVLAVMTLLEGHADYVMGAVGLSVLPSVADILVKFKLRRQPVSRSDQLILRLLGLEMK